MLTIVLLLFMLNHICNKNLMPGGDIEKFIGWVKMAHLAYPHNPYMSLYLAMAFCIRGRQNEAIQWKDRAFMNCQADYWKQRFEAFNLLHLFDTFPEDEKAAYSAIEELRTSARLRWE